MSHPRPDVSPPAPDAAVAAAMREERVFLDSARLRRDEVLDAIDAALTEIDPDEATATARASRLRTRRSELARAEQGLIFGRLDGTDGSSRRIGRVGLPSGDDAEPLVLDWRAAAARAFYTATPLDPQGVRLRRHIRTEGAAVIGVDDEPIDGGTEDSRLVGEAALLAALDERRTGRMGTVVATLQREQDDVVRADARTPLVVQGGPGTGKTVVALHRIAYLLFSLPHLAERGVLVVGPSDRFLDYIAQVLPALGETAVVSATCDTLVPGVRATRREERDVAEIKGRASWLPALRAFVSSLEPRDGDLRVVLDGEVFVLRGTDLAAARRTAAGARSHHRSRSLAFDRIHDLLTDAVASRQSELLAHAEDGFEDALASVDRALARDDDRGVHSGASGAEVDGELSEADLDELRERIAADPVVAATLDAWWPHRDPSIELARFLGDPSLLRAHATDLAPAEVARVVAEPYAAGWSSSDVALLDALADLLGADEAHAPAGPATGDDPVFIAARAAARRDWTYGHVVVDEAQELSGMQWHMVARRCPTRSITAVGDIDQASSAHRHTDWHEAVAPVLGDAWRRADLTVCYRTPREVMELTRPVLERAGSRNAPPHAVRAAAVAPWTLEADEGTWLHVAAEAAHAVQGRYPGGTVGVVAPAARVGVLRAALPDSVPVLSAGDAKGLEWDAAIVVDRDGIVDEPRGWNGLYVALTRCTQELGEVVLRTL